MKRILSFLFICILCVAAVLPVSAATVPLNPTVSATEGAIAGALGSDTAGAAIVLLENGERVMMEGFGYADMEARSLVTATTSFEIGKLSSLFVLLSVHELQKDGLLDPNASISNYLSTGFMEKLSLEYPVTTNDLLYGAAGFEGRLFDLRFERDAYCFDTLEDALLACVPRQVAAPGTYHTYSEFGIGLAAFVVECVAHKSYTEYVKAEILEPLGMHDTLIDPKGATIPETAAKGHLTVSEGQFAVADGDGRSYSVLAPVNGAISTAADMTYLLSYMLREGLLANEGIANGVFRVGAVGAQLGATTLSLADTTFCFGSALCVDAEKGSVALVLTNSKESSLLALPDTLCGALLGTVVTPVEELPDLAAFEGVYADASYARNTLLGRMLVKDHNQRVKVNGDGTLQFGDRLLRQAAPGVFVAADSEENVAVLQFLTDEEGAVVAILSSEGATYLPVSFLEQAVPAYVLFILLLAGSLYFIGGAVFQSVRATRALKKEESPAILATLTWSLLGTLGALTLVQVIVALTLGSATFASFFTAFAVLTTIVAVLAVIGVVLSFLRSLRKSDKNTLLIINAILLVIYLLLTCYWCILYIG